MRWPGSNGPAPYTKWKVVGLLSGPIESKTCLLPMITDQSRLLLRLHSHYKRGVLMHPSLGLLEQPNPYLQAMELLDQINA